MLQCLLHYLVWRTCYYLLKGTVDLIWDVLGRDLGLGSGMGGLPV